VLRLPAGKYVLTRSFKIDNSISIKGDGSDKVCGSGNVSDSDHFIQ
jgi:hypothetical protein